MSAMKEALQRAGIRSSKQITESKIASAYVEGRMSNAECFRHLLAVHGTPYRASKAFQLLYIPPKGES